MTCFESSTFRQHFPLLSLHVNQKPLIYFDNAATTQKPQNVIDTFQQYYSSYNANVHRASHALSARATEAFELARLKVKDFINSKCIEEIIWTKGTTEGFNLIAQTWGLSQLKAGDVIVLSYSEHHANIVPWQLLAKQTGAIIKILPLTSEGRIDENLLDEMIIQKTRIVSVAHISNVLGRVNPIEKIIEKAKAVGAITIIDGAQAIAHQRIDVQALGCDFYLFSAHKMFGPTGVGVLYGRKELLNSMPPYQGGGEMIKKVSFSEETTFNDLPFKFEPGTPNIAGILAFSTAIDFVGRHLVDEMLNYENQLLEYCFKLLSEINELKFVVSGKPDIPLFSFTVSGHHNHDIAAALDSFGIAVRSGHHCAMPLMSYLELSGCLRVSLTAYNTFTEVDYFVESLVKIIADDYSDKLDVQSPKVQNEFNQPANNIIALFKKVKGWDGKHREIMMLGKTLVRLPKDKRTEQSLISGCESLAWLTCQKELNGHFSFSADSDAKVIRGLLVIILAAFDHKTAEQIIDFDVDVYFKDLGLMQHLSPSRGNGVYAIVEKIRAMVS
ncbi:MAG: SufS family cysteine desulfurase [Alteromonadaceae bacterium]|nr:SufS family cysteine desulfurase [Alteromonadaceae bacterium]